METTATQAQIDAAKKFKKMLIGGTIAVVLVVMGIVFYKQSR
jgi:hypothetical protein